jgi:hypothetical protein
VAVGKKRGDPWGIALFSQPTGPPMIFLGVFFIVNFVKVKLVVKHLTFFIFIWYKYIIQTPS